jgi:hypothetical protein
MCFRTCVAAETLIAGPPSAQKRRGLRQAPVCGLRRARTSSRCLRPDSRNSPPSSGTALLASSGEPATWAGPSGSRSATTPGRDVAGVRIDVIRPAMPHRGWLDERISRPLPQRVDARHHGLTVRLPRPFVQRDQWFLHLITSKRSPLGAGCGVGLQWPALRRLSLSHHSRFVGSCSMRAVAAHEGQSATFAGPVPCHHRVWSRHKQHRSWVQSCGTGSISMGIGMLISKK